MHCHLEHCKSSSKVLRSGTQGRDPALMLQIGMQRSRAFVAYEMRKKVCRFVSPTRRLVAERKRHLKRVERHNGLDGDECLDIDEREDIHSSNDKYYLHPSPWGRMDVR